MAARRSELLRRGQLAFDHGQILADGVERARAKLEYSNLAVAFVGREFTIADLRRVYEIVWDRTSTQATSTARSPGRPGWSRRRGATGLRSGVDPAELYVAGEATSVHPPLTREVCSDNQIEGPPGFGGLPLMRLRCPRRQIVVTQRNEIESKGPSTFGNKLTAKPGARDTGVKLSYQWLRDGKAIKGAAAKKKAYVVKKADKGDRLSRPRDREEARLRHGREDVEEDHHGHVAVRGGRSWGDRPPQAVERRDMARPRDPEVDTRGEGRGGPGPGLPDCEGRSGEQPDLRDPALPRGSGRGRRTADGRAVGSGG